MNKIQGMEYVKYRIDGSVATVLIDRPDALNALNREVLSELDSIIDGLEHDPAINVILLTGAGEKAFVAGADIAAMKEMKPQEAQLFSRFGQQVMRCLEDASKFTIAAINGYALGGGCELAMACDMRVASGNAKLGLPETTLGLIPGFGGTQRLPRLVGLGRAKELLSTGKIVSAEEALTMGLVNHVVERENLLPFCRELAVKISANSVNAICQGKKAMNNGYEMDQEKAMEYEAALFAVAFSSEDANEGMDAFLQKRKAKFVNVKANYN